MLKIETKLTEGQARDIAEDVLKRKAKKVSRWEQNFLSNISKWPGRLSGWQIVIVEKIASRFIKEKP